MAKQIHKFFFILLLTFTLLIFPNFVDAESSSEVIWDESPDTPINQKWTISFTKPVDPASVHSNSVYVENQSGNKIDVAPVTDDDKIILGSPTDGYMNGETYTLHITHDVKNLDGASLKKSVRKSFTIEDANQTYDVVTIHPNGSTAITKSFATFAEATASLNAGQAIQFGDAIIKMPAGIVVTKPTSTSSLTIIYANPNFITENTYVTSDTELEYVSSTDAYVEIKIAGKKGFIKHENSELIPSALMKNRSYYSTNNGVLTHYIYSNKAGNFSSYQAGKSPSFMTDGVKYYSWDSINFFTDKGIKAGTGYQYFQFLPARSETQYTAEEIDEYIVTILKELEVLYPNNPTYRDASKKSKLLGLGGYLKNVEKEQKVNALLILALAQHESTYGLSERAQNLNNLFGIKVYDDHPKDLYFESVEANIDELLISFFNKNYIPPNAAYAYGAVFGNKSVGFNVKYASDPYWGSKAAGHMYRIDKMMGGKDLANPHTIGMTSTALNVRTGPAENNERIFRYVKSGLPVIIVEPVEPSPWLKIVSDLITHDELFVHGDYVIEIPTVQ